MEKEGFKINEKGHYVPIELIDPLDLLRDELVFDLVERWQEINKLLYQSKQYAMEKIIAFCDLSSMEYDVKVGGMKGNLQMMSFNGRYKIRVQVHEYIVFDERIMVAKQLVDECISEWSKDSSAEIKVLVNNAFDTDKQGNVSTSKILSLRRIKIEDPRWENAMKALADCMTTTGSKSYIRVYERIGRENKWSAITLDMAAV